MWLGLRIAGLPADLASRMVHVKTVDISILPVVGGGITISKKIQSTTTLGMDDGSVPPPIPASPRYLSGDTVMRLEIKGVMPADTAPDIQTRSLVYKVEDGAEQSMSFGVSAASFSIYVPEECSKVEWKAVFADKKGNPSESLPHIFDPEDNTAPATPGAPGIVSVDTVEDISPPNPPIDPPVPPVDPPVDPQPPVDPPVDPVDPPTDPVDPPTDPVDPPTDPVTPPG